MTYGHTTLHLEHTQIDLEENTTITFPYAILLYCWPTTYSSDLNPSCDMLWPLEI